jgi:hypothetical protein
MEVRRLPEPKHRDVREPAALLPFVHAERREPFVQVDCERSRPAFRVVENEHAHTSGLAVAADGELGRSRSCGRVAQALRDCTELGHWPLTEEGERDVKVAARHDPDPFKLGLRHLPPLEEIEGIAREAEGTKEPDPLISTDGTGVGVTAPCQESVE